MSDIGRRQGLINKYTKKRNSQTAGNNNGKPPKLRVACPVCPPVAGELIYASVGSHAKAATCKNNHRFMVSVGAIPANKSYLISGN